MSSSDSSNLGDLLSRAREGGTADRDRLFAECRPYVAGMAQAQLERWMQARGDASDLVQETLLEAHRDFTRFSGTTEGEWLAWLRNILTHNVADFIRRHRSGKRGVQKEISLAPTGDDSIHRGIEPAAPDPTPSAVVAGRDLEGRVAAAIDQLSPEHRQVIRLRNIDRLPFDEIARRMNRSRPAAQMLWTRAIRKLQELV
jgi:RNA polymerase sigma-70 factor (ECF subfamily)